MTELGKLCAEVERLTRDILAIEKNREAQQERAERDESDVERLTRERQIAIELAAENSDDAERISIQRDEFRQRAESVLATAQEALKKAPCTCRRIPLSEIPGSWLNDGCLGEAVEQCARCAALAQIAEVLPKDKKEKSDVSDLHS